MRVFVRVLVVVGFVVGVLWGCGPQEVNGYGQYSDDPHTRPCTEEWECSNKTYQGTCDSETQRCVSVRRFVCRGSVPGERKSCEEKEVAPSVAASCPTKFYQKICGDRGIDPSYWGDCRCAPSGDERKESPKEREKEPSGLKEAVPEASEEKPTSESSIEPDTSERPKESSESSEPDAGEGMADEAVLEAPPERQPETSNETQPEGCAKEGAQHCGGSCVNTQASNTHCGGCGKACSTGQLCFSGVCLQKGQLVLETGYFHTCAFFQGEAPRCWGRGDEGQLGIGRTVPRLQAPGSLVSLGAGRSVKQMSLGQDYTCAILDNGSVVCWGDNALGYLGVGNTNRRIYTSPTPPLQLGAGRTAKQIAVGSSHACVILDNDTVKCWGSGFLGKLGTGNTNRQMAPPANPVNLGAGRTAKQVSVGTSHSCVLLDDNTVKCWGDNSKGQLGTGVGLFSLLPTNPVNLGVGRTAKQISAGAFYTCALLDNDTVKCWGNNTESQLGLNVGGTLSVPSSNPIDLGAGRRAKQIAAGFQHTCALLDNDTVKCWGDNSHGRLGVETISKYKKPPSSPVVGIGRTVKQVAAGFLHTCVVLLDNTAKCWGQNAYGQLGDPKIEDLLTPPKDPVNLGTGRTAKQVVVGSTYTCALLDTNQVGCWGRNYWGQLGVLGSFYRSVPSSTTLNLGVGRTVKRIISGFSHNCVILDNDVLQCWGYNGHGRLGIGSSSLQSLPKPVPLGKRVLQVALGDMHTCVLLAGGEVKCWGQNKFGQLGDPTVFSSSNVPKNSTDLGKDSSGNALQAKQIAAGGLHTCAILSDDTVKCWGSNTKGQLGNGNTKNQAKPPVNAIVLPQKVKQVAAGREHTCVLFLNGAVTCWGDNSRGQLGLGRALKGALSPQALSVNLGLGRTAKQIAAGEDSMCVLLDDNTVKCWGGNLRGHLGVGTLSSFVWKPPTKPIDLGLGRTAKQIAMRSDHMCALLDDNTIKCWGHNQYGQAGAGNWAPTANPIQFSGAP